MPWVRLTASCARHPGTQEAVKTAQAEAASLKRKAEQQDKQAAKEREGERKKREQLERELAAAKEQVGW
jgi:hypothetical protein